TPAGCVGPLHLTRSGSPRQVRPRQHREEETAPRHSARGSSFSRLSKREGAMTLNTPRWRHALVAALLVLLPSVALAQRDPVPRPGPAGGGTALPGLTPIELALFNEGLQRAIQLEAVCDSCADLPLGQVIDPAKADLVTLTNSAGLGARFNGDQCLVCHNQ